MVELVEALLNTSRIDLGTLTIESRPVNLIEISDNVIDDLSQEIKHKSLEIEKKYEKNIPVINTDPKFIRIIFQNLISNAVTYTPRHGRIRISARGGSASGGKKQDSNVLIEVSDTGYGIPKNQQSKIFTKLFRADNAQEINTDGTGLGLYITKAVVERLGGTIWFESKENKGSIFYVSLPLKEVTQKEDIKNLT